MRDGKGTVTKVTFLPRETYAGYFGPPSTVLDDVPDELADAALAAVNEGAADPPARDRGMGVLTRAA